MELINIQLLYYMYIGIAEQSWSPTFNGTKNSDKIPLQKKREAFFLVHLSRRGDSTSRNLKSFLFDGHWTLETDRYVEELHQYIYSIVSVKESVSERTLLHLWTIWPTTNLIGLKSLFLLHRCYVFFFIFLYLNYLISYLFA